MLNKKRILLTNDDGIEAEGLAALYHELSHLAEVIVVAPDGERSAFGHAITLSHPLRFKEVWENGHLFGYAVSGTPVDCVKLAIGVILSSKPDLVISGINLGLNTGVHVIYSGTVSAALEAVILGVPALAASCALNGTMDFSSSAGFISNLAIQALEKGLPPHTILNVNMPSPEISPQTEVVITRQAKCHLRDSFQKRIDPRNRTYYWLEAEEMLVAEGAGCTSSELDVEAVRNGKISITPIRCDLTNHECIQMLREWSFLGLHKKMDTKN